MIEMELVIVVLVEFRVTAGRRRGGAVVARIAGRRGGYVVGMGFAMSQV